MIEQSKYSEWSHLFWQKALSEQLEEYEAIRWQATIYAYWS